MLRAFRWGDNPGSSSVAQYNHKGPHVRQAGEAEAEKM